MIDKLPEGSFVKGFVNAEFNAIWEYFDMISNRFTIFENDEILRFHCDCLLNRIMELSDIPCCNGKIYEIYSAVIESDDTI